MLGVKKHKKWHYTKFNEVWTPLLTLLVFTFVLCLLNFELVVYCLNQGSYKQTDAVLESRQTDNITFAIPMVTLKYQYSGKEYEVQRYDSLTEDIGSKVAIRVNMKAPNHVLIIRHTREEPISIFFLSLWGISFLLLLRWFGKRNGEVLREFAYLKFLKVCKNYSLGLPMKKRKLFRKRKSDS